MSTIDRTYSVGELLDLLAAKDVEIANLTAQHAALAAQWASSDPAASSAWASQFASVQDAYASAKASAQRYVEVVRVASLGISSAAASADATGEYHDVLSALNPSWSTMTVAPGSLDDLTGRLTAAASTLGQKLPPGQPIPQPTSDTGINPTSGLGYLTGLGAKLGLVTDVPPGTPGTAGAPPLIPTWLKWGAAAAVVGAVALEGTSLLKTARSLLP